jgi:hypothetical protein
MAQKLAPRLYLIKAYLQKVVLVILAHVADDLCQAVGNALRQTLLKILGTVPLKPARGYQP